MENGGEGGMDLDRRPAAVNSALKLSSPTPSRRFKALRLIVSYNFTLGRPL